MSKMNLRTVRVTDTQENTEYTYRTDNTPKKSTLGNSYFGTLNSEGIAELQKKYAVNNEADWCALLKQTFGLTDKHIGNRGPKWDNAEQRKRYQVEIGDMLDVEGKQVFSNVIEFAPAYTEKQVKRNTEIEQKVFAVPTPKPVEKAPAMQMPSEPVFVIEKPSPIVQAVADTVQVLKAPEPVQMSAEDLKLVVRLKELLTKGHTKPVLMQSLIEKTDATRALKIFAEVEKPAPVVKAVEEAFVL